VVRSRESRMADLNAGEFAKRKQYKHIEPARQRDIRGFFGSYGHALARARNELFRIGNPQEIASACIAAAEQGLGWLEEGRSLQLHTSMIERLPTVLRIYTACGAVHYGDVSTSDLVKIHIDSGKLTLMKFDDFAGKPLPRLVERIKLNLRSQDVGIFQYGDEFEAPYLFFKSRFINEEYPRYLEF
jgi:DNA phosphorothioation-associated putative methyltransferase